MLNSSQAEELDAALKLKHSGEVHDLDFLCFRNLLRDEGNREVTIIDVGANRGQSIISFKHVLPHARILSFEANEFFTPILSEVATWYEGVSVFNVGLGRTDQRAVLQVPVVDGKYYWEEASIQPENFKKPWVVERFAGYGENLVFDDREVNIRRADGLLTGVHPDIVKVDVEGAELDVIVAMEELITRASPILMVENSDWPQVTSWLTSRDYVCYEYLEKENTLVPLINACTNSFYVARTYRGPLAEIIKNDPYN